MKFESVGILISLKPLGERDSLARFFTYDYGILVGMMRGAQVAKKNKPLIGQVGIVAWNARVDSQLGVFHWEAEKNLVAGLMANQSSLMFVNSAFALIDALVPEREKYENLYDATLVLLQELINHNAEQAYLNWEIGLLSDLGYALNLTCCSGCGTRDNLKYLSPKTGRAVCETCAAPYINRVYKLPLNLNITGRFIQNVCDNQGVVLPLARKFLMQKYL